MGFQGLTARCPKQLRTGALALVTTGVAQVFVLCLSGDWLRLESPLQEILPTQSESCSVSTLVPSSRGSNPHGELGREESSKSTPGIGTKTNTGGRLDS